MGRQPIAEEERRTHTLQVRWTVDEYDRYCGLPRDQRARVLKKARAAANREIVRLLQRG